MGNRLSILLLSIFMSTFASAEPIKPIESPNSYIGFAAGAAFPFNAANVNGAGSVGTSSAIITSSDLSVSNSVAWGAKAGTFFNDIPWLGLELSYYERYPNIAQQGANLTFSGTAGGLPFNTTGQAQYAVDMNYARTVGMAAMAKLPMHGRIAPYVGAGLAVNVIGVSEGRSYDGSGTLAGRSQNETDVSLGPLAIAGVEGKINKNISVFTEARYTRSNFTSSTINFTYADMVLLFGASLGF